MDELLAKPDQSLLEHTRNVLRLGEHLARRLDLEENLKLKSLIACALHDVGKATDHFQSYIRTNATGRARQQVYPHALASLPFVLIAERKVGKRFGWTVDSLHATAAVLSHHSPLGARVYKDYDKPLYHPQLEEVLRQIWDVLCEYCPRLPPFEDVFAEWDNRSGQKLSALLDVPISTVDGEPRTLRGLLQGLPTREFAEVKTVLHLADWLASSKQAEVSNLFLQDGRQKVVHLMNCLKVDSWREYQRQCAHMHGDVLWLRAPTGSGKTEALLLWAGDAERIIYLLPTQATANAMWHRLQNVYGEQHVGLAHGRASYILRQQHGRQKVVHMLPDEEPLDIRLFGSVFAKPVTVATLDQYLLAHLNGRHWEERRTLVRRSVLILDEIHAYEPYTLGMLAEALSCERPARLALASATLPSRLLDLLPAGQIVEAEKSLWERKRHRLILRKGNLLDGVGEAVEAAKQGKRVLIVANTVADAQSLYRQLDEQYGWEQLHLLHARFVLRHRQEKERQVRDVPSGTIFVATQVVEVSLDINYDMLLTEIAPVDALIQRMGRVNRYGDKPPAPVHVFASCGEGAEKVYGQETLQTGLCLLEALPELPTDRDLAEATEALYQQITASPAWKSELQEGRQTVEKVQDILGCYTIDLSDDEMRSRFTARRGSLSIEVIPEQFVPEAYQMRQNGQGWRMAELLVPVPIYWLKQYRQAFTPSVDLGVYITQLQYDSHKGLTGCPSPGEVLVV